MKRDSLDKLKQWRAGSRRKPLILRGARQVGKSWLVREFGKGFEYLAEVNFEHKKRFKEVFKDNLDPKIIIERLRFLLDVPIEAGKALLFFDEIQECPRAIESLRYFKEEMPELHVIAAGSLLDFALDKIGVPVGRVQFLYLYPLSFAEYLTAIGKSDLRNYLFTNWVSDRVIHQQAMEELKAYFYLGGMPEVIKTWQDTRNINDCVEVQDEILVAYKQDVPKYAKAFNIDLIEQVFDAVPLQLGNKFIYKNVDPNIRSYLIKNALNLLDKAGIIHRFTHSDAQGLPLGSQINSRRFKIFGFDLGLLQRSLGMSPNELLRTEISVKHLGNIAEQFVAQELIAHAASNKPSEGYYWHREDKQSNAEVDFLFAKDSVIYPIEVKSSSSGRLKSLNRFLETHPRSKIGIKVSEAIYASQEDVIAIPFYSLERWIKSEN